MKISFTSAQFFSIFKDYNQAVFPIQVVFYLFSFAAIYHVLIPTPKTNNIISVLLSFFWLWMGVVYHLIFFTAINKAAFVFGAVFIFQSILLLAFGVFQSKLTFMFKPNAYGITGLVLLAYALIIYPVLGYFSGHIYPYSPTLGLPCHTTILTFGFLLLSEKKCPVVILVIPFLWAIVGFTATFNFGIWEDTGLLIAALLSFTMILIKNRKSNQD